MEHHDSEPQSKHGQRRNRRQRRPAPGPGPHACTEGDKCAEARAPSPTPATSRTVSSGLIKIDVSHEPTVLAALARLATARSMARDGGCSLSYFSGDSSCVRTLKAAQFFEAAARSKDTTTSRLSVTTALPMPFADVTPLPDVPGVGETWLRHGSVMRCGCDTGTTFVVTRAGRPGVAKRLARWIEGLRLRELERVRKNRLVVVNGGSRSVRAPTLDVLIHPPGVDLNGLVSSLRDFRSPAAGKRYERAGRPWRIVVLLTGPPGCGKTASILAVCAELGITDICTPKGSFGSSPAASQLSSVAHGSTVVVEDVERCEDDDDYHNAMFSGPVDKPLEKVRGASSRLLNALDGAMAPSGGTIIFLTSNQPQMLCGAVLRRTDIVLTFDWATDEQVARLVEMWFTDDQKSKGVQEQQQGDHHGSYRRRKKARRDTTIPAPTTEQNPDEEEEEEAKQEEPEQAPAAIDVRVVAQQFAAELRQHIGTIPLSMAALSAHLARTRRAGSAVVTDLLGSGPFSAQSLARDIKEQVELATIGSAKWAPDPSLVTSATATTTTTAGPSADMLFEFE